MRKLQNLCGIVVALALVLSLTFVPTSSVTAQDTTPPRQFKEVPQEIKDLFEGGIPIEEFLAMHNGPIPFALQDYAETEVTVIVEMTQPSLAAKMVADKKLPSTMSPLIQAQYVNTLELAQKPVLDKVLAAQGKILGQFTKSYNGLMVRVSGKDLAAIRALPGVKAVHRAPEYVINMDVSVPLIGADYVQEDLGFTGEGVTIAVIDSGIDYTHASFGGAGTAAAYAANDPDVIEPGSFPTAKVIGGWDFAGTGYDAGGDYGSPVPVPDPDPLDEGGHGSHVASTAAGLEVPGKIGTGVAPEASLYALKVFGAEGSTNLTMNAIEWAMDPNGDGDIADHVDVINMSLGSSFGPADPNDPDIIASNNAVAIGIIVVASSGNAGDSSYITGSPAAASGNISVAASTTGSAKLPFVKSGATEVPYLPANSFTSTALMTLVDVDLVDGTGTDVDETTGTDNGTLCNDADSGAPPVLTAQNALTGKLALIMRSGCSFEEKLTNAAGFGAIGAIIYNHDPAGDYISMAVGTATLPAGFALNAGGLTLKGFHNLEVAVGPDTNVKRFDSVLPADYVADFSSRGPRGTDSMLKPEITAPGVAIFAAQMGSGSEGVSFNGTSMAAPHVAGVAALIRQAHPDWTVEQVKAAMMNTAVDLADLPPDEQDVPRTGAGRVDAAAAVDTDFVAVGDEDLVSLSWGVLEVDVNAATYIAPEVKSVRVYNYTDTDVTFTIDSLITGAWSLTYFDMPPSVTVPAHGWQAFPVILGIVPFLHGYSFWNGKLPDSYGFITLTEEDSGATLRVPFYVVMRPISTLEVSGTPDLTVDANGLGEAEIVLDHTGPIEGNLWSFAAMHVDGNELDMLDSADQRMIGIDWYNDGTDDYIDLVVNTWGSVHDPQPYFAEHGIFFDVDADGIPETVNFNYNTSWFEGGDDTNIWIVAQIDFVSGYVGLGSPEILWTDFNTGIVEFPMPAAWNYIDEVGTPDGDTDYHFWVKSFDYNGNVDTSPVMYFDNARLPFGFDFDVDGQPYNSQETVSAWVNDLGGYLVSQPKGIMLVDYHGKPGAGQAYFWPLTVVGVPTLYFPVIMR